MSIYVCVVSKLTIAGGELKLHGRNCYCTFIYQFKSSAAKITRTFPFVLKMYCFFSFSFYFQQSPERGLSFKL